MRRRTTAAELARDAGVDPKRFRYRLRQAENRGEITWHRKGQPWIAQIGSPEHRGMEGVLTDLLNYDLARERLRG